MSSWGQGWHSVFIFARPVLGVCVLGVCLSLCVCVYSTRGRKVNGAHRTQKHCLKYLIIPLDLETFMCFIKKGERGERDNKSQAIKCDFLLQLQFHLHHARPKAVFSQGYGSN